MSLYRIFKYTYLFLIIFILGCSTKKNTPIRRAYHNTTARYNVYFNAKEAYKAGVKGTLDAYQEDFNNIIPVFKYSDKESLSGCVSDMDRTLQKCAKLIKYHSITAKPKMNKKDLTEKDKAFMAKKDYCNLVDDSYLLMGKASFYKQDYFNAGRNFDFVTNEFKNEPIKYKAQLWNVRTKIESKNYEDAVLLLVKIKEDPKFPEELLPEYYAIYSDALIKSEQFDEATEKLQKAIELAKKKKTKTRYTFILAQVYQRIEDNAKASEYYAQVLDMNPSYDLEFNARIRLATSFSNNSGDVAEIKKILKKLLKDEKNEEFRDQIYYALANIALAEGDEALAIEYYEKSIQSSVSNNHQMALSYIALGEINIDKQQYIQAQPFYDSSMSLIDQKYHDYKNVSTLSKNLNELVINHNIIETEDSLQRMAVMSQEERDAYIDDVIEKIKEDEQLAREIAEQQKQNSMMYNKEFGSKAQRVTGKWYFYNDQAVALGKQEFVKRWGTRKLEDNWRRSNKSEINWDEEDEFEDDELSDSTVVETKKVDDKKSKQFYLQDLPLNDSLLALSNERIEEALFNKGLVYMEKIEDAGKAIETFEEFISRFPDSRYMPVVYYYLYNLYTDLEQHSQALKYKNLAIQKYPDSKYAMALKNPNYIRELRAQLAKVDKLYRATYKQYLRNNLPEVIAKADEAFEQYPESELLPKFAFLKAVAQGKLSNIKTLKKNLEDVKKEYPESEIVPVVEDMLEYLKNNDVEEMLAQQKQQIVQSVADSSIQEIIEEPEIYFFDEKDPHLYVIVANTEFVDINRMKFNVINYNLDFFSNFDFKIASRPLSTKYSMVTVLPLTESSQAMSYFQLVNISDEIFEGVEKNQIEHFVISQKNYNVLISDKRVERYLDFFYENYQ